jgi:pimeloyl-ACP methyl ester carboxylesterase
VLIEAAGQQLEVNRVDVGAQRRPSLVFLHEGLGSASMWKDFPSHVAHSTGCNAIVYSRNGHGKSPLAVPVHAPSYMHDEALQVLPALLDRLDVERPILIGHSDGASIALIYAAASGRAVTALVAMAPHVMVEDLSVASIAASNDAFLNTEMRPKLARYHADADAVFRRWNRIWLSPEFRSWNIEALLPRIPCPVLAIQGADDEYGTMAQVESIQRAVDDAEILELSDCRHSPHKDQPAATLEAVTAFVDRVTAQ